MEINYYASIAKNIKEQLFNYHLYEPYICELMNCSKYIFPDKYEYIEEQSDGQCDFEGLESHRKYDAKLPLPESSYEPLTNGKKHPPMIDKWLEELIKEESGFNSRLAISDPNYIRQAQLYKFLKHTLNKEKADEDIILFYPFPISLKSSKSIYLQFASDYLSMVSSKLKEDKLLGGREIFSIQPTLIINEFLLRNLSKGSYEYITNTALGEFFQYHATILKD